MDNSLLIDFKIFIRILKELNLYKEFFKHFFKKNNIDHRTVYQILASTQDNYNYIANWFKVAMEYIKNNPSIEPIAEIIYMSFSSCFSTELTTKYVLNEDKTKILNYFVTNQENANSNLINALKGWGYDVATKTYYYSYSY